ncbi:restriction endonuclease subunit S [Salinimicrobium sediminilitoris]|uniref:restriction endonuclease subunit S n=1 Tax=Salinimicrobium sediminilitoris TaxID=2876715 RepID=UPI001E407E65|nr:restriction endonuclease subunit S [Salinimicrobium sediminilitoris]MCC8358372.1 restriction endonuclease subunit S [Salinimicrobium sediminilitoris]
MPENWKTYRLEDLGTVVTGKTPSSKHPEHFGDHLPFVTPTDFSDYHKNVSFASRYLSTEGIKHFKSKILPPGSVLVTCIGSQMGKVVVNKTEVLTNQQLNSIIPNKNADSDFLYYKLCSIHEQLRTMAGAGSTMPMLNKSDFGKIEIEIPEIEEQKSIASILSALDDRIELNLQMNKTLEEMAMALYKHWFVDFGPFQDGEFVDSELGEIPKGWEVKTLKDIGKVIDSLHKTPKYSDSGYPMVRVKDVKTGFLDLSNTLKVNEEVFNEFSKKYRPKKGDIIMTRVGTYGISSFVGNNHKFCLGQNTIVVISKNIDSCFLYTALNSSQIKKQIEEQVTGSTQKTISLKSIRELKFALPIDFQNDNMEKFVTQVTCWYNQGSLLCEENQTLTKLRDTLLPKLISGEVRVKDVEKTLSEVL